ncbi:MAG TPA: hypothetical protein ENJ82_10935, partial [Bacteroidetes bacterium]|nr:hypothetical protein [Bacteroidota bacterium]
GPALILVVGSLAFSFFTGDGTLLDRVCWVLLNFGIAMIIDSRYLAIKKEHPKVFWVPGVLALLLSGIIYFFSSLFGMSVNGLFDGSAEASFKHGEVLIELGPDDNIGELDGILEKYGAEYRRAFPFVEMSEDEDLAQYYLIHLAESEVKPFLEAVRKDKENIDHATLNFEIKLDDPKGTRVLSPKAAAGYLANDPGIAEQWWLSPQVANEVHAMLKGLKPKRKAKVAVVDTGVDGSHEDLSDVFGASPGGTDLNGHGTHCAGLAGAATNNGRGMASFNWEGRFVEVRGYQALGPDGRGDLYMLTRAITQAAEDGVDVISLSLGGRAKHPPRLQREAIAYAQKLGCIVIAAAGNDHGEDALHHAPSNVEGVIAVSAVDISGHRAPFSNVNTSLKYPIAAPGKDIFSTMPNGEYKLMSGTSMATPIVSGLVGVMRALHPQLTGAQAWKILHQTGHIIGDSPQVGNVINPLAALRAVQAL